MTRQNRLVLFIFGGIAGAILLYGAYIGFFYLPTQMQFAFYGLFAAFGWSVIKGLTTGGSLVVDSPYRHMHEASHHARWEHHLSDVIYDLAKRLDKRDWMAEEMISKFHFRIDRIEAAIANLGEKFESFDKSTQEVEILSSASEIIERKGLESIRSDDLKTLGKAAAILVAKGVINQGDFAKFVREFNRDPDMNFPDDLANSQFGRAVISNLAMALQQRNLN